MQLFFLPEYFTVVLLVVCRRSKFIIICVCIRVLLQSTGICLTVECLQTVLRLGKLGLHRGVSLG